MQFQGLHLYTVVVYDFAQGCQVQSGSQKTCTGPGARGCSAALVELWGGFGFGFGVGLMSPLTLKPLLLLQVAQVADLAQLVESCKSTVAWMLEVLQSLSGQELTDYLGMTG